MTKKFTTKSSDHPKIGAKSSFWVVRTFCSELFSRQTHTPIDWKFHCASFGVLVCRVEIPGKENMEVQTYSKLTHRLTHCMAVPWPQKHDILAKISLKRQSAEIPTGSPRKVYGRPFGETQSEFRRFVAFVRFMVFKGSNLPNVLICIGFRGAFEAMMCQRLRCDIGCVGACHPPHQHDIAKLTAPLCVSRCACVRDEI